MNNEAADATEKEDEPWDTVKDRHTWVDEIGSNAGRFVIVLFVMAALGYCLITFVGKDKGVDPNVPVNILAGILGSLITYYFGISKHKSVDKSKGE